MKKKKKQMNEITDKQFESLKEFVEKQIKDKEKSALKVVNILKNDDRFV